MGQRHDHPCPHRRRRAHRRRVGLLVGIFGYRHPGFSRTVVVPLLDVAQATPQFAYLVPLLIFFGNNGVSAMLATLIFAVPPMVRATTLALT